MSSTVRDVATVSAVSMIFGAHLISECNVFAGDSQRWSIGLTKGMGCGIARFCGSVVASRLLRAVSGILVVLCLLQVLERGRSRMERGELC